MKENEWKSTGASSRSEYIAPEIELIPLSGGMSILEIVSLEGEIYDFEDGDDF